jgi:rhamnosyltransferase
MNARPIGRSDICAVIVTYFPKPSSAENLQALAPQVGRVLIVDNGSSPESFAAIEGVARTLDVSIMRLGENFGIAAALNAALKFARDHGYRWLATFDQDSQATPGMIEEMVRALESFPQPERIAVVTPCHVDRRLGFTVRDRGGEARGSGWRVIHSTMTSGNLVAIQAALEAGGFDDSLFIDYVDHEFCLRLRRYGYRVLEATGATLLHSLGAMERRLFLFKYVSITNHGPVRRYYMTRNRLIVWRRYWKQEPFWVLRDMRRLLFETVYVLLYERDLRAKVPMILRGLAHGVRGVRGPLSTRQ